MKTALTSLDGYIVNGSAVIRHGLIVADLKWDDSTGIVDYEKIPLEHRDTIYKILSNNFKINAPPQIQKQALETAVN